ncbi:MAG: hypothetical protein SGILL_009288 [Bacillariaceae sp.]
MTAVSVASSDGGGMFQPLACNANLAPCEPFSAQNYTYYNAVVEIPCGSCIEMDLDGDLHLEKGLDVQGKLVFPSSRRALKITTPFVFVQGELMIEPLDSPKIPQPEHLLEFHLVGTETVSFTSHHNQTFAKCSSENGCSVSKKPFIVAGGSLKIEGMQDQCQTWSRLLSYQDAGAPSMDNTIAAPVPPVACSSTLVLEPFDDATSLANHWDGRGAPSYGVEDGHFSVSQRNSATEGPRIHLPFECITSDAPYMLSLKYRYRHNSTNDSSFGVPYLKMIRSKVGGGSDWINIDEVLHDRGSMASASIDEWHSYQTTVQFDDIMTDPAQTSSLSLYIAPFSDVDAIDIDDFQIELAPAIHFEGRSCQSLLSNGDADESGGHVYPFYPTGGVSAVVDDGASSFFRSSLRTSTWPSILSQEIAPECLAKAAVYSFSAKVRVDSADPRQVSFAIDAGAGAGNLIANCPPSSNNEWVTCSGDIRISEELAAVTSPRLYTRVLDDEGSTVDIADISLTYSGGRITKLTLEDPTGIVECWGSDAEILITSHTIQHEDSQVAVIESVSSSGIITLKEPIFRPMSMEDDSMTAVEVALLTRNILLTAAEDDTASPLDGGHLMVMHTSAPPLHFHMCDSVVGSLVSKVSIRDTKQRGIVVHGTNDLYLGQNILHNTRGR